MPEKIIAIEKIDNIIIISFPKDELDADRADQFANDVESLIQPGAKIIFDMSDMKFIDSSGLGAILTLMRRVKAEQGALRLCCLTETAKDILELVRLNRVFDIYKTKQDALNDF
jgi:anti-sigma B factor antagonist